VPHGEMWRGAAQLSRVMIQRQGILGAIELMYRFSRLGQRISIPIMLSQNLNPYIVLGSTVLPFSAYAAAYHFIIMPRKKRRIATCVSFPPSHTPATTAIHPLTWPTKPHHVMSS
jgi:hypothetical protein